MRALADNPSLQRRRLNRWTWGMVLVVAVAGGAVLARVSGEPFWLAAMQVFLPVGMVADLTKNWRNKRGLWPRYLLLAGVTVLLAVVLGLSGLRELRGATDETRLEGRELVISAGIAFACTALAALRAWWNFRRGH
ncbi:MAG: hypothetical protein GC200_00750 [Tepidisphaera sp.]|nr:hypothetical protein [Tepidisphaera sp.]